jgi:hypothetical protein
VKIIYIPRSAARTSAEFALIARINRQLAAIPSTKPKEVVK